MRLSVIIILIFATLTSCYKKAEEIPSPRPDNDTAIFTILGGGFNETIRTNSTHQTTFSDPRQGYYLSHIELNSANTPFVEIYLESYKKGSYVINGIKNRAYLDTPSIIGDAISGTITITEQTGYEHFAGNFNLSFRNNPISPTDTIVVIGTYIADQ